ncbi:hypothetical protein [Hathewaya massiliensis]|uniref:hypothetical protein n=1 Tax=Hathewaya massiliensis TaxID=1964382 RepID=UPI001FA95357|nr:hypothetical protein [Hathewaya massiliensis]
MFKDEIKKDLSLFTNSNEFAEIHIINRRKVPIIIDNDRLQERSKKEYDGIIIGDILYFVALKDYGNQAIKPGEVQLFDGKPCNIVDVRYDMGMYEVILSLRGN